MNAQTKVKAETLAMAMATAFGEIEAATKASKNEGFKQGGKASKYADLTSVIEAIKPALVANGLFFTQHPEPSEGGVCIETVLHHCGGEHLSLGKLFVPADRSNAHGYGSALTYARRYALVTAFGVPVEDDDGNAASAPRPAANDKHPADEWGVRPKGDGPTKTHLDTIIKEMVHEIEGCGDEDMLIGYTNSDAYKQGKALLEEYRPSALFGPAPQSLPEYVPIRELVKRKVMLFRMEAQNGEPNHLMA